MVHVAMNVGLVLGPIVSGFLVEVVGFFSFSVMLGECHHILLWAGILISLGVISLLVSISCFINFKDRPSPNSDDQTV